ncbi:MAG: methylated-DNA--[protein]-cysteine S-methyltransferase [Streptosporangiaceae bacterium]|nr:methylated-DNA--[protein]-cysteine S-methyltransferase [Streptosporangiaceae bacterium]
MHIPAPSDETMARLRTDLAERAAQRGLLDVAYAAVDSPVGPLTISVTDRGVVRIAYDNERLEDVLDELAAKVSPRILHAPARLDPARRELDEYFAGQRTVFDLPLDWTLTRGFRREVLKATARIPYAGTTTYNEIAAAAGSPRAFRAAGTALATNPIPIIVPCHRVLPASGAIGGYRGGSTRKQQLLRLESRQV